ARDRLDRRRAARRRPRWRRTRPSMPPGAARLVREPHRSRAADPRLQLRDAAHALPPVEHRRHEPVPFRARLPRADGHAATSISAERPPRDRGRTTARRRIGHRGVLRGRSPEPESFHSFVPARIRDESIAIRAAAFVRNADIGETGEIALVAQAVGPVTIRSPGCAACGAALSAPRYVWHGPFSAAFTVAA